MKPTPIDNDISLDDIFHGRIGNYAMWEPRDFGAASRVHVWKRPSFTTLGGTSDYRKAGGRQVEGPERMDNPQLWSILIRNASAKALGFGCVLLIGDRLVPGMFSASIWPVIWTTLVLTGIGAVADVSIVPRFGNRTSLLMGFPAMIALIWFVPKWFPGTHVTWSAAFWLALCAAPIEYVLHRFVLSQLIWRRVQR